MRAFLAVLLVLASAGGRLAADEWMAPTPQIFASANGRYALKTVPKTSAMGGRAKGLLFGFDADGADKPTWSGDLVNVPHRAMVADTGKYFVTFDTWGRLGYEHAVVVYDAAGRVIVDLSLEALTGLTFGQLLERVKVSTSSRWWRDEARIEFTPDSDQLVISMKWGQVIHVALATGDVRRGLQ